MVETTVTPASTAVLGRKLAAHILPKVTWQQRGSFLTFKIDIKNGKDFLNGLSSFAEMLLWGKLASVSEPPVERYRAAIGKQSSFLSHTVWKEYKF